jgi:serine protease inhibitor
MRYPLPISLALLALAACGTPTEEAGPPPLLTELPRALSPAELRIVEAANAFTFDLMRQATRDLEAGRNAFLSPLSASMALGMTLNGANGETFDGMLSALRLAGMTETEVDQGYRDLTALLTSLDRRTEMRIANSIWARVGLPVEPAFFEAGRTFFDAQIQTLDFGSPDAVTTINDWVSQRTNARIPRLLESIQRDEVMFLINAIYFKGKWRTTFDPSDTQSEPFHGADGQDRTASLMHQEETLPYYETPEYQAVDLLYGNGSFAMSVLLPAAGRTPLDLLAGLDTEAWRALVTRFHEAEVQLTLPKFRLEYSRQLNSDLAALGMEIAFDAGRADFYRIADVRPERLFISRVEQKTFVEVNEEGTEAAAATNVGISVTSLPQVVEMKVDRPFLFAIRERLSGTIMFLGVMNVVGE